MCTRVPFFFMHAPLSSPDANSVLAQTSLGAHRMDSGDSGDNAPSSLRYEATNLTVAISGGLSVRLWAHRNFKLLWDQARSDVVVPPPGAAQWTAADARFAFAAVQHETTRGLATVTLYAPDRGGGAEGHKVWVWARMCGLFALLFPHAPTASFALSWMLSSLYSVFKPQELKLFQNCD